MPLPTYFAQKAFIVHDGCLLVVRRAANDPNHPGLWEVPGGRLDEGEDLDQHIQREVKEETGLIVTPGAPFFAWKWEIKPDKQGFPSTIVAIARHCTAVTFEVNTGGQLADDFLDQLEWIKLSRLHEYDWIPNMIPVVDQFLSTQTHCMKI